MKKTIFLISCCLLMSSALLAQNPTTTNQYGNNTYNDGIPLQGVGTVNILLTDPRIDDLVQAHLSPQTVKAKKKGYRIQLLQNQNRDLIRQEKARLLGMYPEMSTYELYDSPNFKLRVGDFTNRFEAYGMYYKLKTYFKSAFIVNDRVND